MIGCGGIARWHMSQLSKIPDVEIVALVDPSSDQIKACRHQFPNLADVPTFENHKAMLAEASVDAVEISTPHDQHFAQLRDSFEANKHVFIEKPFVSNPEQAMQAIEARDSSGKIGLLAYQRHTQAEYQWIRRKVQGGELGAVQGVSALLCQEWKRFTTGSWRQDLLQSGGGMLNDSGSHILDVLHWCTGLQPETVTAYGNDRGAPVDINTAIAVRFIGGALGTITIMGDAQNWHEDFTIWCEKGSVFMRNGKLTLIEEDGSRIQAEEIRGGSNPNANFINAILGKEEVLSPFEAALPVLRLTAAIYKSIEGGGQPVTVS